MTRHEEAQCAARKVAEAVAKVALAGLAHWNRAWEIVAEPSRRFADVLASWERLPEGAFMHKELNRERVTEAANGVIAAWREAARRWEAAGRPNVRSVEGPGTAACTGAYAGKEARS